MSGDVERNAVLYHGTTRSRSKQIVEAEAFSPQTTYFALGPANRDLAEIFARRTQSRYPREGGPALVIISVPEETIDRLRQLRLLRPLPFDPGDRPELRNRMQWVLEPGGINLLNVNVEDWQEEAIP